MAQPVVLNVEINSERTFESRKDPANPRTFYILQGYADLPGHKYPQAVELFVLDQRHRLAPGNYQIPLNASVKENRPHFEFDLSAARSVSKSAAA